MHRLSRPVPLLPARFRHGGARRQGPLLDFSASVNPLGPPLSVLRALRRAVPHVDRYPDPDCSQLVRSLAARYDLALDQVVVGNGSAELISALARAVHPQRTAIVEPTFTEYWRASALSGASVEHWLADGDGFDLAPFDLGGVDLVWLCNPNNPTGRLWPEDNLIPWITAHRQTVFAVDEAFLPFRADEPERSLIPQVRCGALPNLVVLRSFTKLFAMPGIRLGYAVAAPELVDRLRQYLAPWSVNSLAQAAGVAAVEDLEFVARTHVWQFLELDWMSRQLAGIAGLEMVPSQANFILLRTRYGDAADLIRQLEERDLVVRDAANFVGLNERYLRLALRSRRENALLVRELLSLTGQER